jgi:2-polyprenyl-3-methyl-5-hydroxy-6-metoxy-1,4-benzoquinol methylase
LKFPNFFRKNPQERAGREQPVEFYDKRFAAKTKWRDHYTNSRYYPVWTVVVDRLKRSQVTSVMDIGCGPGQVACLLKDQGFTKYLGVDFSPLRVEHAKKICPEFQFQVADIFESDCLSSHHYDAVIILEFLEHIDRDLEALGRIRPGTLVIGTVPNFPDDGHVRYFKSHQEVRDRYQQSLRNLRVDSVLGDQSGKTFYLLEGVT